MKNKILLVLIIVTSFFIVKVNAQEQLLTYNHKETLNIKDISNITSYKDGYIVSLTYEGNTIIYNYNKEDKFISSKEISSLSNTSIIKYNDYFLVIGISNNALKAYLLDTNLQIKNQKSTEYILNYNSKINTYRESDKVYLMITDNNQLSSSTIYEIDELLDFKEDTMSSLGAEKLKSILKGDYYLIHFNSEEQIDSRKKEYYSSTYLSDKYILVGSEYNENLNPDISSDSKGIMTYIDSTGKVIKEIISDEYESYNYIEVIKDKLLLVAKNKENEYYLLTYDFEGNLVNSTLIENVTEANYINGMYKIGDKIALVTKTLDEEITTSEILFYSYNLNIYVEESLYGTVTVAKTSIPYGKVDFRVTPNAGYEVESIIVKDVQGVNIKITDNSFVMPENDCTIMVTYKEVVKNPETFDYIWLITLSLIIISFITIKLYKKMSWLK